MIPMPPPQHFWRERFVVSLLLCAWGILAARLLQLHWMSGDELGTLAARQKSFQQVAPARPGEIVDRRGRVFATSVAVRSVYVVPSRLASSPDMAAKLATALNLDAARLCERIAAQSQQQFLWVKRRITEDEADRVRQLKLPSEAWGFREEYRRLYPQGEVAAHVIGFRNIDGQGRGGVEESFDSRLRGHDGFRELVRDARGRVLEVNEETAHPPRHGQKVVLTLDAVIQVFTEQALDEVILKWKPQSACAIVLEPKTGELLAMASRPAFDPNAPDAIPAAAWKNRPISDMYEPGSTFKPFVVAWAIKHGCIQPDEVFDCEHGEFRMGGRVLHDHHPYGPLNVVDILVKSSNIGMAKIGLRLKNERLYDAAISFGFGGPTGIELPGELSGRVRPLKKWNSYSTGSIPMGQELAATPLQIIAAYAALSNGGKLITPHVVLHESGEDGPPRPVIVSQAIDPSIADWIRRTALTAVVSRGTGKKAELKGLQVFGKTGTAQKLDPETGLYSKQLHVSSFVCGAPADDPRVLVLVSVDEPSVGAEHFGGSVAAPAAGRILKNTLVQLRVPAADRIAHAETDDAPDDTVVE